MNLIELEKAWKAFCIPPPPKPCYTPNKDNSGVPDGNLKIHKIQS